MSPIRRVALAGPCLAAGLTFGAGCIGIEHHVRGVVLHTQPDGCSDVPARTALSGATVRIECPGQEAVEVITEMGGRFRFDEGEVDGDCAIVVTKPGYRNRRYAVGDVCVDALEPGGSSEAVSMTAHLVPSRVPPPLEEAEP